MRGRIQSWVSLPLAALTTMAVAGCGGEHRVAGSGRHAPTPTVSLIQGAFPGSLDPGKDYSSQGSQVNWIVYTGLVTYAHRDGTAGNTLIPGLATALPRITDGGRTYTVTLRKGLKFSNGAPVEASDFITSVERAIKIPWGGSGAFITPIIQGGTAFLKGKAKTISGIRADDETGRIVIHLTESYGPFDNVLAFPALGLVPGSTPLRTEADNPPPGVGPYKVTDIVSGRSYDVVKNPDWTPIPGIPSGHVDVDAKVGSDVYANAWSVLNNSVDVLDWSDTIPGPLLSEVRRDASDRLKDVNLGGATYYVFLNVRRPPFNHQLAREAVITGLNQKVMDKLSGGALEPGCFFLPPAIPGHPSARCPYGDPASGGNIAKARRLIQQSGQAGAKVSVFTPLRPPAQEWMTYYASFLNQIGLKASIKLLGNAVYFSAIGDAKLKPQTGLGQWSEDFPDPTDFYLLLNGRAIQPTDNANYSQVNDPKVNAAIRDLGPVPVTQLTGNVLKRWESIDEYVAKKAYVGVFGYPTFPFFMSDRMNFAAAVEQPLYGWDFTSFQLK